MIRRAVTNGSITTIYDSSGRQTGEHQAMIWRLMVSQEYGTIIAIATISATIATNAADSKSDMSHIIAP